MTRSRTYSQSGFTLVELLVTMFVASIFLISAYLLTSSILSMSVAGSQHAIASNIAYSNLRQYANGRSPSWFSCDSSNPTAPVTLVNITTSVDRLSDPVVQQVTATAPYGCGGDQSGLPIRVESSVTYGAGARKVTHVSYASY